jgi:hypothetical protein
VDYNNKIVEMMKFRRTPSEGSPNENNLRSDK